MGETVPHLHPTAFRLKNRPLREMITASLRDAEEMYAFAPEINRLEHAGQEFEFLLSGR